MSYQGKHIAIVGYGVEGQSTYRYVKKQHPASVVVFDDDETIKAKLPQGVQFVHGIDSNYSGYDAVFRTPPVRPERLKSATNATSSTIEFFKNCPAQIIGVTGTKGKGTTVSLIAEILRRSGKKVHVLGNIGEPALDALNQIMPNDIVVFELSSFQLWDMEVSPHIAVVLRIGVDHLDVHKDREEYVRAKSNIARHQKQDDVVVFMKGNESSEDIADKSKAKKIAYFENGEGAWLEDDKIMLNGEKLMNVSEVGLIGGHNLENICAALTASWQLSQDINAAIKAVKEFSGLEHRLEFVAEVDGVRYYNDSFSTTPEAAIAAVKAFDEPLFIILGGSDKGSDFEELASTLMHVNLKEAVLIGEQAEVLESHLKKAGVKDYAVLDSKNIDVIVSRIHGYATKGDVVVLSPACASFDMFDNYKDRGNKFKAAVSELEDARD